MNSFYFSDPSMPPTPGHAENLLTPFLHSAIVTIELAGEDLDRTWTASPRVNRIGPLTLNGMGDSFSHHP